MVQVKGFVEKDGRKQSHPVLHGTWDGAFKAAWADGSEQLLWQKNPPHEHPSRSAASCSGHSWPCNNLLHTAETLGIAYSCRTSDVHYRKRMCAPKYSASAPLSLGAQRLAH